MSPRAHSRSNASAAGLGRRGQLAFREHEVERDQAIGTAALQRGLALVLVHEEMLERAQEVRTEAAPARVEAREEIALQQVEEEALHRVLRRLGPEALAAQEEVDGLPVRREELLQGRPLCRPVGTRAEDQRPAGGGEHGRRLRLGGTAVKPRVRRPRQGWNTYTWPWNGPPPNAWPQAPTTVALPLRATAAPKLSERHAVRRDELLAELAGGGPAVRGSQEHVRGALVRGGSRPDRSALPPRSRCPRSRPTRRAGRCACLRPRSAAR